MKKLNRLIVVVIAVGFVFLANSLLFVSKSDEKAWSISYTALPNSEPIFDPTNSEPIFDPIIPLQRVNEGKYLEFKVFAYDPDGDDIILTVQNLPEGATFTFNAETDTGIFSWIPNRLQEGSYPVTFFATDNGTPNETTAEMIVSITVGQNPNPVANNEIFLATTTPPNSEPIFDPIIPLQTVNEGEYLEFEVFAYDPGGDDIILTVQNLPEGATFTFNAETDTGIFSWIPNRLQEGSYPVTFYATDNGTPNETTAEMIVSITVGQIPNPVAIIEGLLNEIIDDSTIHHLANQLLLAKDSLTEKKKPQVKPAQNCLYCFITEDIPKALQDGEITVDQADYLGSLAQQAYFELGGTNL